MATPEQIKGLLQIYLGASQDIKDKTLPEAVQITFDHIMKAKGQDAIVGCMLLLTKLNKLTPPAMATQLNNKAVATLYAAMPHPPHNMTGYDWRSADGADNLGKAGMPYARSVPAAPKPKIPWPDRGDVFRKLLQRTRTANNEEEAPPSPAGESALLYAFGTLVIHTVFNTDRSYPLGKTIPVNKSSSYVDLSLLYGDSQAEVDEMRNRAAGRGYIWPDCFADTRVLILPPAAAALLVLFNRNHNYIADNLLRENERGTWHSPPQEPLPPKVDPGLDPAKLAEENQKIAGENQLRAIQRARQDEEIFQTAHLINAIHFANIVVTDYVGTIMDVPNNGGGWPGNADALSDFELDGQKVSRGDGSLVSIEFNILYRWHASLSRPDVTWFEERIKQYIPQADWDKLNPPDFRFAEALARPELPPKFRTFAGLKRNADGRFDNNALSNLIYDSIEAPAGFFRARGTPLALGFVDVIGIQNGRDWDLCSMNQFREWLGLPPFKSFLDWNANKEIADAAEKLYGTIDRLELYPGLHAEGSKDDGLMPPNSYHPLRVNTMRNGLLHDAVALIRGDRFLTSAATAENLTKWGAEDVKRVYPGRTFGGHIHKLFARLFPENFPNDSIYTHIPMSVPSHTKALPALPKDPAILWDFDRPVRQYALAASETLALSTSLKENAVISFNSTAVGVNKQTTGTISLNLLDAAGDEVLHISLRRDSDVIVFNTRTKGAWQTEERIAFPPSLIGPTANITVANTKECFKILINNALVHTFNKRIKTDAIKIAYRVAADKIPLLSSPLAVETYASRANGLLATLKK